MILQSWITVGPGMKACCKSRHAEQDVDLHGWVDPDLGDELSRSGFNLVRPQDGCRQQVAAQTIKADGKVLRTTALCGLADQLLGFVGNAANDVADLCGGGCIVLSADTCL